MTIELICPLLSFIDPGHICAVRSIFYITCDSLPDFLSTAPIKISFFKSPLKLTPCDV